MDMIFFKWSELNCAKLFVHSFIYKLIHYVYSNCHQLTPAVLYQMKSFVIMNETQHDSVHSELIRSVCFQSGRAPSPHPSDLLLQVIWHPPQSRSTRVNPQMPHYGINHSPIPSHIASTDGPNVSHSSWHSSQRRPAFSQDFKSLFVFEWEFVLCCSGRAPSNFPQPECHWNSVAAPANYGYLVKRIKAALCRSQECGMDELLTKETRLTMHRLVLPDEWLLYLRGSIRFRSHLRHDKLVQNG